MPITTPVEASPLDDLRRALLLADPTALDAAFTSDAVVTVPAFEGWTAAGRTARREAWARLLGAVDELDYRAERRYLSPDLHGEEGVLSGRLRGEAFRVSVRVLASVAEDGRVRRLEVSGDASGLPSSLRPALTAGQRAFGSMLALMHPGTTALKVVGSTEPLPPEVEPEPEPEPEAPAVEEPPAPRRRPRRAVVLTAAGAGLALAAAGVVLLLPPAEPPPAPQTRTDALVAPGAAAPPPPDAPALPDISTTDVGQAPQVQPGEQLVLRSDVLFATDSSTLTPEAAGAIAELARGIRDRGVTGTIQVNGYTDSTGTDEHDLRLSQARALSVAQALREALAGVDVTLLPQGFGKADPVADNSTEQGRALNRRVTVVLPTP